MSWSVSPLNSVCDIQMGSAPSGSTYVDLGEGVPLIAGAADYGDITPNPKKATTEPTRLTKSGDIILCVRATIGDLNWADGEYCLGRGVAGLRTEKSRLDSKYLWYFLLSHNRELYKQANGSTFPQINREVIENIPVPLPPLATQKHIARVLEQADQLRKQAQQMEHELNQLAQSMFLEMFGDPMKASKKWSTRTLKAISTKFNDGPFGSNLKSEHYTETGVRVIRLQNIATGKFIDKDKAYVSEEHAERLNKFWCRPGDIVIATLGEPNLRACLIPEDMPLAINKADCVHCVPAQEIVEAVWLMCYLNLPQTLALIAGELHGQTRTRIASGQLAKLEVPIPPIELQRLFTQRVAHIRHLQEICHQQITKVGESFESLMQRAFNGELTAPERKAA